MTGLPHGIDDPSSAASPGGRGRQLTTVQKIGVAGLVLLVALGFIWLRQLTRADKESKQDVVPPVFGTGDALRSAPPVLPVSLAPPQPPPAMPLPEPSPAPQQGETAATSPILAFSGGSGEPREATSTAAIAPAPAPSAPPAKTEDETKLGARLHPTLLEPTKARLLPHPDFLLTKGTIIPCILQTAINTELAGFVKCVTPRETRSTTGNVVVLDKGTMIVGEIERGLQNGEDRVFVLWDRAETPDHAIITLASPGTDELGRSGLPGVVDTHFWERFGAAIMLSVVQGGLQAGSNLATSSPNGGTTIQSFQGNGQELANTALVNSINIPPTLEKNQGDNVAIFVARDLDFSDIYALRPRGRYAEAGHGQ
jgi:type IV secretion system protein VirB10